MLSCGPLKKRLMSSDLLCPLANGSRYFREVVDKPDSCCCMRSHNSTLMLAPCKQSMDLISVAEARTCTVDHSPKTSGVNL